MAHMRPCPENGVRRRLLELRGRDSRSFQFAELTHDLDGIAPLPEGAGALACGPARHRMGLAANLLRDGRNSAHVAYEVGFGSEAAFSRAFRKEYGVPPGQWQRTRGPDSSG